MNVKKTADYVNWDAIQEIQKEEEEEDSAEEEYVNTMAFSIPPEHGVMTSLQTQHSMRSNRDEIYAPVSIWTNFHMIILNWSKSLRKLC